DSEVDIFNKYRHKFKNTQLILSDKFFLEIARNKENLNNFLIDNQYQFIKTYTISDITNAQFPLIAKPKDGRSSEGIHILNNLNEYKVLNIDYGNYIFQEILEGNICTIDVVKDKYGNTSI